MIDDATVGTCHLIPGFPFKSQLSFAYYCIVNLYNWQMCRFQNIKVHYIICSVDVVCSRHCATWSLFNVMIDDAMVGCWRWCICHLIPGWICCVTTLGKLFAPCMTLLPSSIVWYQFIYWEFSNRIWNRCGLNLYQLYAMLPVSSMLGNKMSAVPSIAWLWDCKADWVSLSEKCYRPHIAAPTVWNYLPRAHDTWRYWWPVCMWAEDVFVCMSLYVWSASENVRFKGVFEIDMYHYS